MRVYYISDIANETIVEWDDQLMVYRSRFVPTTSVVSITWM